ncbi:proprotein convertase P-domain-containing protein [Kaistella antarctica]|uniref:Regulatory P domain of the subtilisin-like proprotein convertases and other proteases n=1 Tax=Kaistella antarctica TaxID=266748 RepID=A0A448NMV3_9FLAO|nr:proprotein convertase P-domain-containing protein [Kaistella antarctica]KEY19958.1 hypothetical protein HY04_01675 [Kaistella antarctica]SEV95416.1 Por secretion system C-terminal sorting domain-containing protein [Kaistella antarctica]VEH95961.1 Regulatory P domain of the subtilisin-like proprotein convertases and other proteases [Kaistella antarctica]
MKKLYFLAVSLLALSSILNAQTYQNIVPTTLVDAISRSGGCGYNTQPGMNISSITVPLIGTIVDPTKITLNVSLKAAWLGDISVELVSPTGEAITLIRRIGAIFNSSCGDSSSFIPGNVLSFNAANTTLIDAEAISNGFPIPPGNYAPTYSIATYPKLNPGNLTTFLTGKQLSGEWRLYIYDYGQGEATGINSWQIIIGSGATMKTIESGVFGNDISLKQNPVQDQLLFNVQKDFKNLVFEIYDPSGKMIKKENMLNSRKDFNIDVRTLSPGMYLLIPVKDGERQQTIKFIKK